MTLVASAMSVGAFAQETGYFRVVNVGYYLNQDAGIVNVSSAVTAQPDATKADAETMAGTVMYIKTEAAQAPAVSDPYIDYYTDKDLKVLNLRSQAVDADSAIYAPMTEKVYAWLQKILTDMNTRRNWQLTPDDIQTVLNDMFSHMEMYLEPVEYTNAKVDGDFNAEGQYYYLKSTTPRILPLIEFLNGKGIEISKDQEEGFWNDIVTSAKDFFAQNNMTQELAEWDWFTQRIHLGHTYYLIGGRVEYSPTFGDTPTTEQEHNPGNAPFISFANNNTIDYTYINPEIQVADVYAIWKLVPVDEVNPFVVKGGVTGKLDGKYYTTGYFDFPFVPADGVKAYGIKQVFEPKAWQSTNPAGENVAYVKPELYEETVPAKTPVVIESADGNAILLPTGDPAEVSDETVLKGVFFDASFDQKSETYDDKDEFRYFEYPTDEFTVKQNVKPVYIAREFVRVFNKTTDPLHVNNPIGFFYYKGSTIKANKGWIDMTSLELSSETDLTKANVVIVDADTFADGITEIATAKSSSNVVYDIQGRIVSNPTKGLYIVNGKKVIK
jgi:hypothetical protein